jgi:Protein of unknown function (DUF551)
MTQDQPLVARLRDDRDGRPESDIRHEAADVIERMPELLAGERAVGYREGCEAALAAQPAPTERAIRRILCAAVAGPLAYMDDGEASTSEHGGVDFLRESPEAIREWLQRRGLAKLAAPTVDRAIEALVSALAESKGWMRSYADSIIRDAIDRATTEMSPEFTDTSRAALAWVLWHHQGSSSEIGQAMRFALGMGATERMSEHHVAEAKRWASLAKLAAPTEQAQPVAYIMRPKVQRNPARPFIRGVYEGAPDAERYEMAALDGDEIIPLYATPPTAQPAEQATQSAWPWIPVSERLPASGVTVLACYDNRSGRLRRIRASWVAAKSCESSPESEIGEYDEETDCYYDPEGWYEKIDNWGDFTAVAVCEGEVTHWMPLPAPPQEAGTAATGDGRE